MDYSWFIKKILTGLFILGIVLFGIIRLGFGTNWRSDASSALLSFERATGKPFIVPWQVQAGGWPRLNSEKRLWVAVPLWVFTPPPHPAAFAG
jgi:hypothetical protein